MDREEYKKYLHMLGDELQKQGVTGEILVTDDVTVILDIREPEDSDEIDAYFGGHASLVQKVALEIAQREHLADAWLVQVSQMIFHAHFSQERWLECPGLRIYTALPDYALAMKIITGNSEDIQDIRLLAEKLQITSVEDMLTLVAKYISHSFITEEMRALIKQSLSKE